MVKKSILRNHLIFEDNINKLLNFGNKVLSDKLNISKKEKTILIESILLRGCAHWESFIENEIVNLIYLEPKEFSIYIDMPENTNYNLKLIRAILFGGTYIDFGNIEKNKSIFKKLLDNKYNSLSEITAERSKKLSMTYILRNYVSHQSQFSRKKLKNAYDIQYNQKIFQEPGIFLLKNNGKYFEDLMHNFVRISIAMRTHLGLKK